MYEVKFRNKEDKNILCVLELPSSIHESINTIDAYLRNEIKEVYSISPSQYKEAFHDDCDISGASTKWYAVTMEHVTINEKGKETTQKYKILVEATDFDACYSRVKTIAKEGYEMTKYGIKETNIELVLVDVAH
jgi:hypothetical protein